MICLATLFRLRACRAQNAAGAGSPSRRESPVRAKLDALPQVCAKCAWCASCASCACYHERERKKKVRCSLALPKTQDGTERRSFFTMLQLPLLCVCVCACVRARLGPRIWKPVVPPAATTTAATTTTQRAHRGDARVLRVSTGRHQRTVRPCRRDADTVTASRGARAAQGVCMSHASHTVTALLAWRAPKNACSKRETKRSTTVSSSLATVHVCVGVD